jgi:hypothetical protein
MQGRFLLTVLSAAALTLPLSAQGLQRRAVLTGGGGAGAGRCSGEVLVDGGAEISIRGDTATMRDLSGRPPEWRRFECTGAMPMNPGNVRFHADGRGHAQLVGNPNNGGTAVIRIEDPEGGAEVYRFDISWDNAQAYPNNPAYDRGGDRDGDRWQQRDRDRGMNGSFGADQAVQVCEDAVRQQAMDRFHTRDVYFRRVNMDDNPGRHDWVVGAMDIHPAYGPEQHYRFSCSVNFDTGRVRSAQIDPMEGADGYRPGTEINASAVDNCRRAVAERARRQGYDELNFTSINVDNNPGRRDWVVGSLRAQGPDHPERFDFSCSVNLENGYVRSVDMTRR